MSRLDLLFPRLEALDLALVGRGSFSCVRGGVPALLLPLRASRRAKARRRIVAFLCLWSDVPVRGRPRRRLLSTLATFLPPAYVRPGSSLRCLLPRCPYPGPHGLALLLRLVLALLPFRSSPPAMSSPRGEPVALDPEVRCALPPLGIQSPGGSLTSHPPDARPHFRRVGRPVSPGPTTSRQLDLSHNTPNVRHAATARGSKNGERT